LRRVGSGSNIHIWDDEWIPGSNTRKILTPKGQDICNKVEELINPVDNQWDEELIEQTF
jgi:hypothetical protein